MKGIHFAVISLVAFLVVASCSYQGEPFEAKTSVSESSGTMQSDAKKTEYGFDKDTVGVMPAGFSSDLTGRGSKGEWVIKADPTAPSKPNIIAQISSDSTSYRFPLAIADDGSYQNPDLSVMFKPVSGKVDQAAGLVWRYKDAGNYYIVRANALEDNVVLYKVEGGRRSDLPLKGEGRTYGKKVPVPSGEWSRLRVRVKANLFEVFLNGQKLYEVEDDTFKEAGKIGLWTKADSVTHFDNLQVTGQ